MDRSASSTTTDRTVQDGPRTTSSCAAPPRPRASSRAARRSRPRAPRLFGPPSRASTSRAARRGRGSAAPSDRAAGRFRGGGGKSVAVSGDGCRSTVRRDTSASAGGLEVSDDGDGDARARAPITVDAETRVVARGSASQGGARERAPCDSRRFRGRAREPAARRVISSRVVSSLLPRRAAAHLRHGERAGALRLHERLHPRGARRAEHLRLLAHVRTLVRRVEAALHASVGRPSASSSSEGRVAPSSPSSRATPGGAR